MRLIRLLQCGLLLLSMTVLLSCENSADLAKKQITPETIKEALANKTLTGPDGDVFIELPGAVELIKTEQTEDKAIASVNLKALDLSTKTGVDGKLELSYRFENGQWKLQETELLSMEKLNVNYAKRLTELVDFPLHFAANIGDLAQVKKALKNKAAVNAPERGKESTAVMFASERGRLDIVQYLVANGADVAYSNRNGLTALHVAAYGNYMDIVELLVEKGADVNALDKAGKTPLYFAASSNAADAARYLVAKGADINARGEKARPPIFAAARSNSVEVAKYLVDAGAEVNIKSEEEHYSPLLSAAYYNSVELVDLLLDAGADTSAQLSSFHRAETEYTALELAEKRGYQEVVELLKKNSSE